MTDPDLSDDSWMGVYVYCASHIRPHATGWCTVHTTNKRLLASITLAEAIAECGRKGYPIMENR